MNNAAEESQI